MSGRALVLVLQALALIGSALTAAKLYRSGLYTHYRVFFAYFLFRIPNGIWSLALSPSSNAYFYCWIVTEPLFWIFELLVVRELIGLVLKRHKGLYTLGRWAMYFGIAVSVLLSVLSLSVKLRPTAPLRSRAVLLCHGCRPRRKPVPRHLSNSNGIPDKSIPGFPGAEYYPSCCSLYDLLPWEFADLAAQDRPGDPAIHQH